MKQLMSTGLLLLSTTVMANMGANPALAQTSVSTETSGQAIANLDGSTYQFEGTCLLMGRNGAMQLRVMAPGTGPEGEAVFLTLYATSFAPTQYVIHGGATPDKAREAAMADTRETWNVRGATTKDATEFSEDGAMITGPAQVSENGEIISSNHTIEINVNGC
ncbi:hypothetical protein [Marinobacter salarius]|uniref:hypothetical protein n=1 Tax=Marinobacter salarius TaxID=1420917 RepID=UPI0032EAAC57